AQRMEITLLVEMFRARVVDVSPNDLMIEISGQERKIEAFIDLMRPYGIVELARTGRIALVRGTPDAGDVLCPRPPSRVRPRRAVGFTPSCSPSSSGSSRGSASA